MPEEERQLSALLQKAVPQPPRSLSFDDIARQATHQQAARPRRLHGWVPALAAACILLVVAAGGIWLVRVQTGSRAPTTKPAASRITDRRSSPTTSTSPPAGPASVVGPWAAKALTNVAIALTTASSADAVYGRQGNQIVRFDPGTGKVLARAAANPDAIWPLLATTGALWQAVLAHGTVSVQSLDPDTLQPLATHPIAGAAVPSPTGPQWTPILAGSPDNATLFLGDGSQVYALDAATGSLQQQTTVHGLVDAMTTSADSSRLYVGTNPQGSNTASLVVLDARQHLSTISETALPGGPVTGLLASSGGIWATVSGGHADSVWYLPATDLSHGRVVSSGGGGAPSTVTLAGGAIWLGGPNTAACADPTTGALRDHKALTTQPGQPAYFGGIALVAGHWLAIYQTNSATGLATFTPPTQCA